MTWPIFGDHHLKLESIKRIMSSKDHAVVAIIGGALLEEAVERTLKERMLKDEKGAGRLFDINRPLSSTSAQIDTLYMLWGIDPQIREVMQNVYRVRNFFAHNLNASFDSLDDKFVKAMAKLTLHEGLDNYPDARFGTPTSREIEPVTTNRTKFIVNLKLCLNYLMQDRCSHVAYSTEPVSHEELRKQVGEPNP